MFTVNLGIYVREIDQLFDDWWGRQGKKGRPGRDVVVREEVCWLRSRLGSLPTDGEDTWWDYSAPDVAASDVRARFKQDAEPAFSEAKSRAALIAQWQPLGRSPTRWRIERRTPLGTAVLLKGAGRADDARGIIEEACRSSRGTPFFYVVSALAEGLGFECPDS
jgi:hypothetical protein